MQDSLVDVTSHIQSNAIIAAIPITSPPKPTSKDLFFLLLEFAIIELKRSCGGMLHISHPSLREGSIENAPRAYPLQDAKFSDFLYIGK
ncbi:hypothetical protein HMPREF9012_0838 [Bacteroidetes bacterium oral taxon 272 str. F0290]|nr:hypothetical protein HMPREF9012_0838 [Bacteroidetes bacterium oral taxon 272 str. F0290]